MSRKSVLLFVLFAACTPVVFAQGGALPRISSVATSPSVAEGQTVSFAVTVTGTALTAEGAFHGTTADGRRVFVRIPAFAMTPPPDLS